MGDRVREIVYFDKPGKANTGKVVDAVAARLAEGDIDTVIVASTTGYTALALSDALGDSARIVSVAETALLREWGHEYPCLDPESRAELERRGVVVAEKIPYLFHSSCWITVSGKLRLLRSSCVGRCMPLARASKSLSRWFSSPWLADLWSLSRMSLPSGARRGERTRPS